jgi:hypothetical protein
VVPAFVRGTTDRRVRGLRREPIEVWVGEPVDVSGVAGPTPRAQYDRIGALVMARIEALMLRSAGRTPLAGLDLSAYDDVPTVPVRRA